MDEVSRRKIEDAIYELIGIANLLIDLSEISESSREINRWALYFLGMSVMQAQIKIRAVTFPDEGEEV